MRTLDLCEEPATSQIEEMNVWMDQRLIFVATMLLIFPSIAALGKIIS